MSHLKKTACSAVAVVGLIFANGMDIQLSDETGHYYKGQYIPHMTISRNGLEHIAKWEGCELVAYQCSADVWTIFLGHTESVSEGDVGTEHDAAVAFVHDVKKRQDIVNKSLNVPVTQPQFDMLVSFTYNVGQANFKSSTMLRRFNNHDEACGEFLRWVYVNKKDCRKPESNCPGIVNRRNDEFTICKDGYS